MVGYAIRYYQDFVVPTKAHRAPDSREQKAMDDLIVALQGMPERAAAEDIQTEVYSVGREHDYDNLRDWFKTLYEVLFGQSQGPRMGSVIALYGIPESIALIQRGRDGHLVE
jgi:lysyl-tRNA synthetase class 1